MLRFISLILLCSFVHSAFAEASASLPVSKLWLDVPKDLEAECAPAIGDFKDYYARITGKALATSPGGDATVPLRFKLVPQDAADETFLGKGRLGDYEIDVSSDAVTLSGKSSLALTNALYGLLDSWGCRWAFPGDLGEVIPKNSDLSIPLGKRDFKIASDSRLLAGPPSYYVEGEVGDWVRRNRFSKLSTVTPHHSWASLIIPAFVYNDPSKPDTFHPGYFSLIGDKRIVGTHPDKLQICTTNPDVIRLAVERAKTYLRENPAVDTFPCSPEDNFEYCQCENCLKLDTGELTPEGVPEMTDRVVAFANEIARAIRDEFPNKAVGIYAYNNYTLPPRKIMPEPNVMVQITRMNYDLLRLMPREKNDSSAQFVELVEAWRKLTPNIYLYEYNPIYWAGGLFCPNYLEYAESQKFFRDRGAVGFRSDAGELPFRNKVNYLNDYLAMRVAVDSEADPKEDLHEICDGLFGPAGKSMSKYYETMAKVTEKNAVPEGFLGGGIRHFHRMFTPELLKEAAVDLAQAKKEVGTDPVFRKRLRQVELGYRYLDNYLQAVWSAQAGDYEKSQASLSLLERTLDTLAADKLVEDPTVRLGMLRGGVLMAQAEHTPAAAGFVQNWKILGPFDNSQRTAETTFAPFEPVTDTKAGVKTADGKAIQWRDYHSPSGFLNFRLALGKTPKDWSALTAYAATQIRVEQPTKVWLSFNSFNSFRIYLNGEEVFFRPGQQLDLPDQYGLSIDLVAGENTLVVRSTESVSSVLFPWGFYLRILDPENPAQPKNLAVAR